MRPPCRRHRHCCARAALLRACRIAARVPHCCGPELNCCARAALLRACRIAARVPHCCAGWEAARVAGSPEHLAEDPGGLVIIFTAMLSRSAGLPQPGRCESLEAKIEEPWAARLPESLSGKAPEDPPSGIRYRKA